MLASYISSTDNLAWNMSVKLEGGTYQKRILALPTKLLRWSDGRDSFRDESRMNPWTLCEDGFVWRGKGSS